MEDKARSRELRTEIRRILMSQWDPIGVSDTPDAADEYDAYIGGIYELIQGGASESVISDHLREIEVDRMEMTDADGLPLLPASRRDVVAAALTRVGRGYLRSL